MRTSFFAIFAAAVLLVASPAWAQDCSEEVVLETFDGTILISHIEALYNCCCTVGSEVLRDGFWIDVHEYEHLTMGGCDCLCCFGVEVEIAGLESGVYTVSIIKHTEHGSVELVGTWPVTVTGSCPPLIRTTYVPCDETGMADEGTWGTIKALYR
ncbi:MAG: hypothetical protein ABIE42_03230 [Candidatus Eisenbacteria bacterium]